MKRCRTSFDVARAPGCAGSETHCDTGFLGQAACALLLRRRPRCCHDWMAEEPQWSLKMACRYQVWFLQLGVWWFLVDRLLWQRWRPHVTMHLPQHSGLLLCAWLLLRTVRCNLAAWTPKWVLVGAAPKGEREQFVVGVDGELPTLRRCWKCLASRYTASSSWPKVLYLVFVGLNFFEKKASGDWASSEIEMRLCDLRSRCFRAKCGHWSFTPKTPNIGCNKFNLINLSLYCSATVGRSK